MKNRIIAFVLVALTGALGFAADHQMLDQVTVDYVSGNGGGLTNVDWVNGVVNKPSSLAGYGITDTVVQAESDPVWSGVSGTVVYTNDSRLTDARTPLAHNQDWSTITNTPASLAGYGITDTVVQAETDPVWTADKTNYIAVGTPGTGTNLSGYNNDVGYLTNAPDPTVELTQIRLLADKGVSIGEMGVTWTTNMVYNYTNVAPQEPRWIAKVGPLAAVVGAIHASGNPMVYRTFDAGKTWDLRTVTNWTGTNFGTSKGIHNVTYLGNGKLVSTKVTASGCVMVSDDYGLTWRAVTNMNGILPAATTGAKPLVLTDGRIITFNYGANTLRPSNGYFMVSSDRAETWSFYPVNIVDTNEYNVTRSFVQPYRDNPNYIVAAGFAQGYTPGSSYTNGIIQKSTDGGQTWTRVFRGINSFKFDELVALDSTNLLAFGFNGAQTATYAYKSSDQGVSWRCVYTNTTSGNVQNQAFNLGNGTILMGLADTAGSTACDLIKSIDYGETWKIIKSSSISGASGSDPMVFDDLTTIWFAGNGPSFNYYRWQWNIDKMSDYTIQTNFDAVNSAIVAETARATNAEAALQSTLNDVVARTNLSQYNNDAGFITNAPAQDMNHANMTNLDYASAGHTGFQPAGDYATGTPVYVESDPVWSGVASTVVYTNDSRLTDARTPLAHDQDWSTITGTPTSLSGYGITDTVVQVESDPVWSAASNLYYQASNPSNFITTADVSSPANIRYVAKNGNDANDGSVTRPFLTVQAAVDSIVNSDSNRYVISVSPGVYAETLVFTNGQTLLFDMNAAVIQGNVTWYIAPTSTSFRAKTIFRGADMRPAYTSYQMNGIEGNLTIVNNAATSRYPGLHLLDCGIKGNIEWTGETNRGFISHVFMHNATYTGDLIVTNSAVLHVNLYAYNSYSSGSASIGGAIGHVSPYVMANVLMTRAWLIGAPGAGGAGGDWMNVSWKTGSSFVNDGSFGGTVNADAYSYYQYLKAVTTNASTNTTFNLMDGAIGVSVTNAPVNYSVSAANVLAHLQGIDAKLANMATGTPVYVESDPVWSGVAGTVVYTNDSRLTDARTPLAHDQAWSTITNTPASLAGYGITDTVVQVESDPVWTGVSNTVVYTNDSRLTDARVPLAHNQDWSTITNTPTSVAGYGITNAIVEGDPRLTNARPPEAHNHAWSDINSGVPTSVEGYGITNAVKHADIGVTVQPYNANLNPLGLNDGGALTNLNLTTVVSGGKFVIVWEGSTSTVYVVNSDNTVSNKMGVFWNE